MAARRWILIIPVAGVVALTLLLDRGYGNVIFWFADHVPGRDATGHFVLMAGVTVAAIVGLRGAAFAGWRLGIRSAVVLVLLLSGIEELSQGYSPYRTVSLGDLFASWFGVVCAGAAMARLAQYRATARRRRASSDAAA
jgi:hypothetical protein